MQKRDDIDMEKQRTSKTKICLTDTDVLFRRQGRNDNKTSS
jgi:hypothetical protein